MDKLTEQIEAIEAFMADMTRHHYRDGFVRRGVIDSIFDPVIWNRFKKITFELIEEDVSIDRYLLTHTLDFDVQYGYSLNIGLATPHSEPMEVDIPVTCFSKREVVQMIRCELDAFKDSILKTVNK